MGQDNKPNEGGIHFGNGTTVHGDVFTGNKSGGVSVGSISNVSGGQINVAGGNIQATQSSDSGGLTIAQAFELLNKKLEALPEGPNKAMAVTAVQGLKTESEKGDQADESKVEQWFKFLAQMAPDVLEVAAATFVNPIAGLGVAFKKIAEKAKG